MKKQNQPTKKPECEPYQQFSYLMNLFHGTYRSDYTNFAGASIPLDVFPNPKCLIEELHKSIANNVAGYISSLGTKEIRELIANYENTRTNSERYSFENVALIPGSATEAISYAFDRIFHDNKGELLISLPNYWLPLEYMKRKLPKVAVRKIPATAENAFLPSIEQIRNNLSRKTRALFICNPLNPSGRAHSNKELEEIISIAAQQGTYVILDESCYDQMFPGNKTPCTQSDYEKLIIIRTWSKDRGRPDFNLGYMIASPELLEERSKGVLYDDPGRIFLGFIKKDMQMRTQMLKEKPLLEMDKEKDKEKSEFEDYQETINANISAYKRNVEYAMKRLRNCRRTP